jgi:hypothetical protein
MGQGSRLQINEATSLRPVNLSRIPVRYGNPFISFIGYIWYHCDSVFEARVLLLVHCLQSTFLYQHMSIQSMNTILHDETFTQETLDECKDTLFVECCKKLFVCVSYLYLLLC